MIAIVDYGMGNLFSVSKALERLGTPYFISDSAEELAKADGLILPGVGSFKDAMHLLKQNGLHLFLREYAESGAPILGICLGMQLLFEKSEENGMTEGLSLLKGKVVRFAGEDRQGNTYKVPHMGWNELAFLRPSPLISSCKEGYVYFVHSFYVQCGNEEDELATADYFGKVPAIVGQGNIYGMQFHPEKSGQLGMELLKNYIRMVEERVAA
ncbi:imidazole glycerol phosphate synthase subunit HisH [Bacillus testis]|uniref:imidazole glycerol phosphate synthase subunit HisH n=1 Tax=Bacillus testis TaxID=1622072 RepID=UPI00067ECD7B|nr:imidazole glycerol phosphate synthase subunit HisH [Bacillus testis]